MDLGRNHANGSDMECQQNERSELMVVENFCVSFKPFDSAGTSCVLKTMFCLTQVNSLSLKN